MSTETVIGWEAHDSDSFGARLALVRQRMGWGNVKEAAVACGVAVESWRGWERDGAMPQRIVEVAGKISRATGCDVAWLVGLPRLDSNQKPPGLRRPLGTFDTLSAAA